MQRFVNRYALNEALDPVYAALNSHETEIQNLLCSTGDLQESFNQLVKLYNSELKQYKACVAAYRKLTSILLEIPEFKEKWDKFYDAPDYDRR